MTHLPAWHFDVDAARRLLEAHFGTTGLSGFGVDDLDAALGAAGALLGYARKTQSQALTHVVALLAERGGEYVRLDAATRRNLELTETLRGTPAPTLFSEIDACASSMGSRLLRHWVHHPLRDRAALAARHEAVEALCGETGTGPYRAAQTVLKRCSRHRAHCRAYRAEERPAARARRAARFARAPA